MEQLPKLVRNRLETSRVSEHPDADLLTAFAEHSVTDRERNQVALHLVQCRECRDVVALAAPEVAPADPVPQRIASGRRWFGLPAFRWGALAASLVIVGAAVLIGTRTQRRQTLYEFSTKVESVPSQDVMASQEIRPPANQPEKQSLHALTKSKQTRDKLAQPAPTQPMSGVVGGVVAARSGSGMGQGVGGRIDSKDQSAASEKKLDAFQFKAVPLPADQTAQAKAKPTLIIPPAAPPAPPQTGMNQLERGPSPGGTVLRNESVAISAASPAPVRSTVAPAKTEKEQAKAENVGQAAGAAYSNRALTDTAAQAPAALMPDLKMPKWTLSQDGLPQRSFDSGKNWEKIPVDNKAGFRALAATGMDVWVGGPAGLLYYSTDIGLHWTRVTPVTDGASLSADIVRIEFPDPLHGKISTGDGATWVTSDQGKTWTKQ